MIKRKWMWLFSVILVLSLLLVACGGDDDADTGDTEADTADTADTGEADEAGEAVTLRVWTHQNDAFNDGLQALADAYIAENPNVEINFETFDYDTYIQTLQTALPAGTEADILQMFGSWTCSYVEGDNLAEVPADVISLADAQSTFFEAPLAGYTCDNTLYGLPQEFNIEYGATLVNPNIAEAAGVGDLSGGWDNWDAFTEDAVALTESTDGVITRAGFNYTSGDALGFTFYSLMKQAGGDYLNEDGTAFTINTPEGQEALDLMIALTEAGVVDPVLFNDEENWVGDCYFEEACAMGLVGPWVVADYAGDYPDLAAETYYAPLPSLGADPIFVADSGWGLTVSNNSEAQDAAWDFIKFAALNAENAVEWNVASGTLPALKANAEGAVRDKLIADFPHFEAFLGILEHGQYIGEMPDRDLLWYDITYPHILNVLQGVEEAGAALEAMEREANETFN